MLDRRGRLAQMYIHLSLFGYYLYVCICYVQICEGVEVCMFIHVLIYVCLDLCKYAVFR